MYVWDGGGGGGEGRGERRGEGGREGGGRELHGVERRFKKRMKRGEGGKKRYKGEEEEGQDKLTWSLNIHMISGSGLPSAVQPRRKGCNSVRVSGVGRVRNEGGSVGRGEGRGGRE